MFYSDLSLLFVVLDNRQICRVNQQCLLNAGNWTQVLGVFVSHGNVKADVLAKTLIESAILCENAGLFADAVTCDGASWNRSMWRSFGIRGKEAVSRSSNFLYLRFVLIKSNYFTTQKKYFYATSYCSVNRAEKAAFIDFFFVRTLNKHHFFFL